jgi:hypothetical protein
MCSLASGPEDEASQNPFFIAWKSSTCVVLYS